VKDLRELKPGDFVLAHSAAGGVGSMVCQWASSLGAKVIGTVSTADKVPFAKQNGCSDVIVRGTEDVGKRVAEITGGAKVSVAYDSVGKDTFFSTLDSVRPRGLAVIYGATSGTVPPFTLDEIGRKRGGAIMLICPGLMNYVGTEAELTHAAQDLWQAVREKRIRPNIEHRFALRDAVKAHREMETGASMGSIIFEI
jgi:NADPH:quinone reductase